MKAIITTVVVFFLLWPTTFFAQDTYQYVNGEEIPLDDFPQFTVGYRIQLGAFSSQNIALDLKSSLEAKPSRSGKNRIDQKVHLRYERGFWKVRVGDFGDSSSAANHLRILTDYLNTKLMPLGYLDGRPQGSYEIIQDKVKQLSRPVETLPGLDGFRLQVKALSDREQALELGRKLDFDYSDIRAYVIHQNGLYKIQLGDFKTRSEALILLIKLEK